MEINQGVSTTAGVSDVECILMELAPEADSYDRQISRQCIYALEKFVTMQDALIRKMKEKGISRKACFGF